MTSTYSSPNYKFYETSIPALNIGWDPDVRGSVNDRSYSKLTFRSLFPKLKQLYDESVNLKTTYSANIIVPPTPTSAEKYATAMIHGFQKYEQEKAYNSMSENNATIFNTLSSRVSIQDPPNGIISTETPTRENGDPIESIVHHQSKNFHENVSPSRHAEQKIETVPFLHPTDSASSTIVSHEKPIESLMRIPEKSLESGIRESTERKKKFSKTNRFNPLKRQERIPGSFPTTTHESKPLKGTVHFPTKPDVTPFFLNNKSPTSPNYPEGDFSQFFGASPLTLREQRDDENLNDRIHRLRNPDIPTYGINPSKKRRAEEDLIKPTKYRKTGHVFEAPRPPPVIQSLVQGTKRPREDDMDILSAKSRNTKNKITFEKLVLGTKRRQFDEEDINPRPSKSRKIESSQRFANSRVRQNYTKTKRNTRYTNQDPLFSQAETFPEYGILQTRKTFTRGQGREQDEFIAPMGSRVDISGRKRPKQSKKPNKRRRIF